MPVLVTGATGALGVGLVEALRAGGHQVRVLTRRPFRAAALFADSVEIHEWHPGTGTAPPESMAGGTTVIHLLGEPLLGTSTSDHIERVQASRAGATARLIEAAISHQQPWRLIVASVAPCSRDADAVLTETSARGAPAGAIEMALLRCEAAAQAARTAAASVAVVRLGALVSMGGMIAELAGLASYGLLPDLRQSRIPAIDPVDAIAVLVSLVERPDIEGTIHAVAPVPLAGSDLQALLEPLRRYPLRVRLPRRLLARRLGVLTPLLLNRARIVPQRLAEMGAEFRVPDPTTSAAAALQTVLASRPARQIWPKKPAKGTV